MNNRILLFKKNFILNKIQIKLIQSLCDFNYEVKLISPEVFTKDLREHGMPLKRGNLITIGNRTILDNIQSIPRRELKRQITNRLKQFQEDQNSSNNVMCCFMLDYEAEEIYSSALRTIVPSAARIFFYDNTHSVVKDYQEKLALQQIEELVEISKSPNEILNAFWNKENLSKLRNFIPDPLEHQEFSRVSSAMLRSDAVLFEPELENDTFMSTKKSICNNFEMFKAYSQLADIGQMKMKPFRNPENVKKLDLELDLSKIPPSQYSNEALLIHEETPLELRILELLQQADQPKFKYRILTRQLIEQFTINFDYSDPVIRAGQVVTLPSFYNPEPFFWDIYEGEQIQYYGGLNSSYSSLNETLIEKQKKRFRQYDINKPGMLELDSSKLMKFMGEVCLKKMDQGENEFVSTVWKYN